MILAIYMEFNLQSETMDERNDIKEIARLEIVGNYN